MLLTLVIAFFSLIALMIIHEFGHFIIAKKFGVRVEEFGIGYPPRMFGKKFGDTIYSINWVPLGAFVKIFGEEGGIDDYRSFSNLAIWKRILIVLGGVLAFWIASMFIFTAAFMVGANIPIGDQDVVGVMDTTVQVLNVLPDSPAGQAGIQIGDEMILAKSGNTTLEVNKITDFQNFVHANKGKEIALDIKRGSEEMTLSLTPRGEQPSDQGPTGVALERMANVLSKQPWYMAPWYGILYTGEITWQAIMGIYSVINNLVSG